MSPGKFIGVLFAALALAATVLTAVGTFVAEWFSPATGAKLLVISGILSAILPRVQWIRDLFLK